MRWTWLYGGSFKHVFIPSLDSELIASFEVDKSGGLSNDAQAKKAKKNFSTQNAGYVGSQIENAIPDEDIRDQSLTPGTKSGSKEDKGFDSAIAALALLQL